MRRRSLMMLLLGSCVQVVACDGAGGVSVGTGLDSSAIPEQPVSFRIGVASPTTGSAAKTWTPAAVPTAVEIDAATTIVDSFRFDLSPPYSCEDYAALLTAVPDDWRVAACEADADGASLRFQGPFSFDLTREIVTPDASRLALPNGTYGRVRLKLEADAPGGEDGVSFLVSGRLSNGTVTPFVLALGLEQEIEYRAMQPVAVDQNGADIVVRLDLVGWLLGAGDVIAGCRDEVEEELGPGAPLVIDARQDDGAECDEVEDLLEDHLDEAGELDEEPDDEQDDAPKAADEAKSPTEE